jgi:hypothetical protein
VSAALFFFFYDRSTSFLVISVYFLPCFLPCVPAFSFSIADNVSSGFFGNMWTTRSKSSNALGRITTSLFVSQTISHSEEGMFRSRRRLLSFWRVQVASILTLFFFQNIGMGIMDYTSTTRSSTAPPRHVLPSTMSRCARRALREARRFRSSVWVWRCGVWARDTYIGRIKNVHLRYWNYTDRCIVAWRSMAVYS